MNSFDLMGDFLKENYGKYLSVHRKNFSRQGWWSLRPEHYDDLGVNKACYKVTLAITKQEVEMWVFHYHYTVVGGLAGAFDIADPRLFQKITGIISNKLQLEPICQPSKMTISQR